MLGFTFASRRLRRNLGQALSERVLLSYFRAVRVRNPPVEAVSAKLGRPELLELPARTAGVSRNARLYVRGPPLPERVLISYVGRSASAKATSSIQSTDLKAGSSMEKPLSRPHPPSKVLLRRPDPPWIVLCCEPDPSLKCRFEGHVLHPKYRSQSQILHRETVLTGTSSLEGASSKA